MIINFLGHLHPVFVHLPIGFLAIAYVIQYFFKSSIEKSGLIDFVLAAGIVSSLLAAFFGWMLSLSGGYEENLLDWHRYTAIAVCIVSIALLAYKRYKKEEYSTPFYHAGFHLMMLALLLAGHFGGEMTHGEGYLFSAATDTETGVVVEKREKEKLTAASTVSVYDGIVEPVLAQKCMQCHNEKKKKGDFQLHTIEALMKGGKNGKAIVAGDPDHSEFIRRILLDKGDEKHMPPKGKSQLTKPELDILSWWVLHGVSTTQAVKEVSTNDTIRKFLSDAEKQSSGPTALDTIAPADASSIAALKKINVAVVPLSSATHFLELNMVNAPSFQDKDAPLLQKISPQVMWLVLADTKITDAGLEALKSCANITKLNLKNTSITNASISLIGQFKKLEYLNIVGTKIDDAGLLNLTPAPSLKKIFCWLSDITTNGVMAFQQKYPNIEIDFGEK
ncbi:MAG: c-type cytochrome domain-containing protein [bacterium]